MPDPIRDDFVAGVFSPHWVRLAVGRSECIQDGSLHLVVKDALADSFSLAQIDDYNAVSRSNLPWKPPVRLETRARFSHVAPNIIGTAGFGFWTAPVYLSSTRFEIPPNWVWFYYASPHSTLSLTNGPAHGWKAVVVKGGSSGKAIMALVDRLSRLPGMGRWLSRLHVPASEMPLDPESLTDWHTYVIDWQPDCVRHSIDGQVVLDSRLSPAGGMAFVAWLDNNYAALGPSGQVVAGNLAVPQRQWLEMEYVLIQPTA